MSRRLIPLLDRVLVQKVAAPEKSIGGVLLPETASKVCIPHKVSRGLRQRDTCEFRSTTCTCWSLAVTEGTCMHATIGMWVQQAQAADL